MAKLGWKDTYAIGVKEVDEQHRALFDLFEQIEDALGSDAPEGVVADAMRALVVYVTDHFRDEERLMRSIDYPHREAHERLHREFVQRVVGFLRRIKAGQVITVHELGRFLHAWLVEHVLGEDMRMAHTLRARTMQAQRVE